MTSMALARRSANQLAPGAAGFQRALACDRSHICIATQQPTNPAGVPAHTKET